MKKSQGRKKNSKGFFYTPDNHLYRVTRKLSDTQNFVYCYHSRKTADSNIGGQCLARGVMDLTTKRITLKKDHDHHDHLPDIELLQDNEMSEMREDTAGPTECN